MPFSDITFTLDKEKTASTRPDLRPNFIVHLRLSAAPPAGWRDLFHNMQANPRLSFWNPAEVKGEYIVITCTLENFEKYHRVYIEMDVATANEKWRAHVEALDKKHQELAARAAAQHQADMAALDALKL